MSKTSPSFVAICENKYDTKWVWGFGAIMVVIIIVVSVVINYSGGSSNQVQMDGEGESASFKESLRIHLLEIEEAEGKVSNVSWLEIGFIILCFKFVFFSPHIFFTTVVQLRRLLNRR